MLDVTRMIRKVRLRAGQRFSDFVDDSEIIDLLQDSLSFLYMSIFRKEKNYFRKNSL